jgi:tetratricopeptide (TPR) repeat protein
MNSIPPEVNSLFHKALQDYKDNQAEAAIGKLTQVLSASPSFEDAHEALSVIFYNQKRYDEAIAILKKWILVNPDAVMSHTNLSRCYVAKGMIMEAEHEQAESRRLSWKAELKAKKQEMPKINYDEQIARFKKVIDLDPADVLGYFSLGNAYLDSGKKREALETFEKAVEVDPKHSSSYLGLGMALEGLGDFKKAKEIYLKGVKVADEKGDMMTQRKMESRLRAIENPGTVQD